VSLKNLFKKYPAGTVWHITEDGGKQLVAIGKGTRVPALKNNMDTPGGRHLSPAQWRKVKQAVKGINRAITNDKKKFKKRIGLAVRSFTDLARKTAQRPLAQIRPSISARKLKLAQEAQAPRNLHIRNAQVARQASGAKYVVTLINSLPYIRDIGGEKILSRAIAIRRRAVTRDLTTGVFKDLKARASRYPGITFKK